MLKDKKKLIIYISMAVLIVIIIAIATVFILQSSNNTTTKTQAVPTKATAAALILDAVKILNSNPTKAKTILQQADQQYKSLKDVNGATNAESLIWQIDHPVTK